jgi:hypothetical protein
MNFIRLHNLMVRLRNMVRALAIHDAGRAVTGELEHDGKYRANLGSTVLLQFQDQLVAR